MALWVGLLLLALGGIALALHTEQGEILGLSLNDFASVTTGVALLILIGIALLASYRGRMGQAVRDVLSWTGLALVLVAGYSFREEITGIAYRVVGELAPPGTVTTVESTTPGERAVRIRRRPDGHFAASVAVDGTSIKMLVDTGASSVVLRQADADRLGVDTRSLHYTVPVHTANGVAYAAHVRLRNVSIGPIAIPQVEALVAQPGTLKESLLGMTFLSRLRSYEFSGEFLTLRG
ncbi:MAG TPA: TIGR02281 family clan AA aspartic protease [Hyphomicrobiaceae bacterium]|nr:TIGR02281 family clan AA aspartic protease [Hyphomicrobiaceae bacterium]